LGVIVRSRYFEYAPRVGTSARQLGSWAECSGRLNTWLKGTDCAMTNHEQPKEDKRSESACFALGTMSMPHRLSASSIFPLDSG